MGKVFVTVVHFSVVAIVVVVVVAIAVVAVVAVVAAPQSAAVAVGGTVAGEARPDACAAEGVPMVTLTPT